MILQLPERLIAIHHHLSEHRIRLVVVGGAVRDGLRGLPHKDYDCEVYGVKDYETLKTLLSPFGTVLEIGKSFGILKLVHEDLEVEFALPRKEEKTSEGHRGFTVQTFEDLDFKDAASRRDFTINAMGYDLTSDTLLDPFDGQSDLSNGCLRHVSEAFVEDPLRVLRAMQFAGRFDFKIAPETLSLCKSMDLSSLPKERLFEEFKTLFLKADKPSIGLQTMIPLGIMSLFPELEAMVDCPQDPEWHPEGDVWVHTLMVVDEMAAMRRGDPDWDVMMMFAALCHDLGKPETTEFIDGRLRSRNHEAMGVKPTLSFLDRLTENKSLIHQVSVLVKEHLKPALLYKSSLKNTVSDAAIRRLALRVPIEDLLVLAKADHFGRTTPDALRREHPAGDWLAERAKQLSVHETPPTPFLKGQHLLQLGYSPGKKIGQLLDQCFQAQLDGQFNSLEEGLDWFKAHLHSP